MNFMIISERQLICLLNVAKYAMGIAQAAKHKDAVDEISALLSEITGQQSEKTRLVE